eukprot:PhF_6_TR39078/c0_g1_i1/m.58483/K03773/fklB; FKBP-type peptidyl-prolyl cis-trans isomerase FklB
MLKSAFIVFAVALIVSADPSADTIKAEGEAFLAEKVKEPGVHKLPSGLLFRILRKGDGKRSPAFTNDCDVHYTGRLPNGLVFDSTRKDILEAKQKAENRDPMMSPRIEDKKGIFRPSNVIQGWREAMQLMCEGDHWELFVPDHLGYGEKGQQGKIPANSALQFEVEMFFIRAKKTRTCEEARKELEKKVGKSFASL